MNNGFTVDARGFNKALDRVATVLKKDAPSVVKDQARLLLQRAQVDFTPPKTKAQGVNAIKQDLFGGRRIGTLQKSRGVFLKVGSKWINEAVQQGTTVKMWANKKGEVYGVEKTQYKPNASVGEMRDAHLKAYGKGSRIRISTAGARDRIIGRWRFMDRMVVGEESAARYLDFMAKRVGGLKSGWNRALKAVGGKIQSFAKKHPDKESRYGLLEDRLKQADYPSITVGNAVPSIMRWKKEWQTLLDTRARDMVKRAEFLLRKARKSGRM